MWINIKFKIYAFLFQHFAGNTSLLFAYVSANLIFFIQAQGLKNKLKNLILVNVTALAALVGARVLHAALEKPELFNDLEALFTRLDGMTFNGSLLFGVLFYFTFIKILRFSQPHKMWDLLALVWPLTYAIMRVGCFSNGCCWGKISAVPWSVTYTQSTVMPWLHLPVHPVQLYDSIAGLIVFMTIFCLVYFGKKISGHALPLSLMLYAAFRFFTEQYRGDSFRGLYFHQGLSTSQIVSIAILLTGIGFYLYRSIKRNYFFRGSYEV